MVMSIRTLDKAGRLFEKLMDSTVHLYRPAELSDSYPYEDHFTDEFGNVTYPPPDPLFYMEENKDGELEKRYEFPAIIQRVTGDQTLSNNVREAVFHVKIPIRIALSIIPDEDGVPWQIIPGCIVEFDEDSSRRGNVMTPSRSYDSPQISSHPTHLRVESVTQDSKSMLVNLVCRESTIVSLTGVNH